MFSPPQFLQFHQIPHYNKRIEETTNPKVLAFLKTTLKNLTKSNTNDEPKPLFRYRCDFAPGANNCTFFPFNQL